MILNHRASCIPALCHGYGIDMSGWPLSRLAGAWLEFGAICAAEAQRAEEYAVKRGKDLRTRTPIYSVRVPVSDRQEVKAIR